MNSTTTATTAPTRNYYAASNAPLAAIASTYRSAAGTTVHTASTATATALTGDATGATTNSGIVTTPPVITQQQINELTAAVNQGVAGVASKKGESAGSIDNTIITSLTAAGDWTQGEISAVMAGLQAAEPHGESFVEQTNGSTTPFVTSWLGNAESSLAAWVESQTPAPAVPGTAAATTGTNATAATASTTPSELSSLASLLGALNPTSSTTGSGSSTDGSTDSSGQDTGVPIVSAPAATSSGGGVGLFLILGGVGLAIFWYLSKHKKGGKSGSSAKGGKGEK